jgi:hypothetical protein
MGSARSARFVGEGGANRPRRRLGHLRLEVVEAVGPLAFVGPAGVRQRRDPGRRFRAGDGGPLLHRLAAGHGADDIGFHHDIGRAADHQQMLDVVAPDQHQPPAAVDGGGVDHRQPRHPPPVGVGAQPVGGESANQPGGDADQGQHGNEREEE